MDQAKESTGVSALILSVGSSVPPALDGMGGGAASTVDPPKTVDPGRAVDAGSEEANLDDATGDNGVLTNDSSPGVWYPNGSREADESGRTAEDTGTPALAMPYGEAVGEATGEAVGMSY